MNNWANRIKEGEREYWEREHVVVIPARYAITPFDVVLVGEFIQRFARVVMPRKTFSGYSQDQLLDLEMNYGY